MRKFLSWLLTPPYLVSFVSILVVFHPLLMVAHLCGPRIRHVFFNLLNFSLVTNFRLVGTRITIKADQSLPTDRPLIVVSNHQSMYDIPLLVWAIRRHNPKFISKVELGRWLPSISFALRNFGSVLIDRSNPRQALPAIKKFGQYIETHRYAACIFPEGTRARDGHMKHFKPAGLRTMLESVPSALVLPVVIDGSWEILRYKLWPVPFGVHLSLKTLPLIDPKSYEVDDLCKHLEHLIRAQLAKLRGESPQK